MKKQAAFMTTVLLSLVLVGCGGQDPAPEGATATPSPAKSAEAGPGVGGVSGSWTGSWTSTGPEAAEGSIEVVFEQEDTLLGGEMTVGGSACVTTGFVSGTVDGTAISFSIVSGGEPKVTVQGTVTGDTASGTFENACGEAGTWEISRSS